MLVNQGSYFFEIVVCIATSKITISDKAVLFVLYISNIDVQEDKKDY